MWQELEEQSAREYRRQVYHKAARLEPEAIDDDDEVTQAVESLANSFDYLEELACVEKRLRSLATRFYGVTGVRCWALLKPWVGYMLSQGRRAGDFHQAFRDFAEKAANDARCGDRPEINRGHDVWIDNGEEVIHRTIWDDDT